jgi:hypothetical protein
MEGRRAGVGSRQRQKSFFLSLSCCGFYAGVAPCQGFTLSRRVPLTGRHPRNPALLIKSETKKQSGTGPLTAANISWKGSLRRAQSGAPLRAPRRSGEKKGDDGRLRRDDNLHCVVWVTQVFAELDRHNSAGRLAGTHLTGLLS